MEATASRRNYPVLHEFNPSIHRHARARSRRLILFSLGAFPKRIVRKQYYFRPSDRGFAAWDVDRLVRLSRELPRIQLPLRLIRELDEPFWFGSGSDAATCRAIVEHARLIDAADLSFPIILSVDGRVMDGMHRVAKAALLGHETIAAVQFASDLEPDFVDVQPEDLPYEDTPKEAPPTA